jgi:CDP-glycerol glycerophosphotransferase (TagB/SpsB family)
MVLSWDNNTSKGLMRVLPDNLIVQNEVIKKEAIRIQAVPSARIVCSGIPHYDYYRSLKPMPRGEYEHKLGIPAGKKIVLVCPAGEKFISTDWHSFEILKRAQKEGKIGSNVTFLISIHPSNKVDFGGFVPDDNFIIKDYGHGFKAMRQKENELGKDEIRDIIDMVANADVMVNTLSSMIIDAIVLDRPVVTVGFAGWSKDVVFTRSVDLYLQEENMADLLATHCTRIARSPDELVQLINMYLDNPAVDSAERHAAAIRQCWKLDGHSAERIVSCILIDHVNEKQRPEKNI